MVGLQAISFDNKKFSNIQISLFTLKMHWIHSAALKGATDFSYLINDAYRSRHSHRFQHSNGFWNRVCIWDTDRLTFHYPYTFRIFPRFHQNISALNTKWLTPIKLCFLFLLGLLLLIQCTVYYLKIACNTSWSLSYLCFRPILFPK